MDYEVLTIQKDGDVATLWLDRPEARNAMGPAFWSELPSAIGELTGDPEVRAIVVAAKGPHFSVGLDLKTMGSVLEVGTDPPAGRSRAARSARARVEIKRMQDSVTAVAECPKPVIAAVHGYCIGGGVDLVSACDIRFASEDAAFSVRETKMAIVADLGSLQRLPRIIGAGHLAELAFTGKDISAARAKEIGLVNDVLPDADAALKAALSMAAEIAANSPLVVQGTKAVLQAADRTAIAEGLEYVAVWNAGFLQSDDLTEAFTAFMEKRPPKFTGN
jgi:enoyl-CoA hydratase